MEGHHILQRKGAVFCYLTESNAGEYVRVRCALLGFYNIAFLRLPHQPCQQRGGILDAKLQNSEGDALSGLHHTGDAHLFRIMQQREHGFAVARAVNPYTQILIIGVSLVGREKPEGDAEKVLRVKHPVGLQFHGAAAAGHHVFNVAVQLVRVFQAHGVEQHIGDATGAGEHQHTVCVPLRPGSGQKHIVILI